MAGNASGSRGPVSWKTPMAAGSTGKQTRSNKEPNNAKHKDPVIFKAKRQADEVCNRWKAKLWLERGCMSGCCAAGMWSCRGVSRGNREGGFVWESEERVSQEISRT